MVIPELIQDRRQRWGAQRCMLVKVGGSYREISWAEYYEEAERTALGLLRHGFAPGTRAAILSPTRFEWAVADTAVLTAAGVSVPIYPTLTGPEVRDLLARSQAEVLFVSEPGQLEKCLPLLPELPALRLLVCFEEDAARGRSDQRLTTLQALQTAGEGMDPTLLRERVSGLGEDDLATIIFTSGTTGEPKGVMLSHRNILSNVEASLREFEIGPSDVCLAHLPLAHIFERMAGYYLMLWCGTTIAYAESLQQVIENMTEVRPTLAISVPRLFEKIYAGLVSKAATASAPVKALTFWAIGAARRVGAFKAAGSAVPWGLSLQLKAADVLVYAKLRRKLGGRLRFFVSGGAPLSPELALFFDAVGIPIYEGYGLTETSPVVAVNTPVRRKIGSVGRFVEGVSGRISGDGEILVRGANVFLGYLDAPEATREVIDPEGWLKTGDLGEVDGEGYLRITGRKKDLLITAGGKNVAPQKVENALKRSKYVAEAMLYGDRKKYLTALVVPDFEWLRRYAGWKRLDAASPSELVRHPQVQDHYRNVLAEVQKKAGLASFETVKKFILLEQDFSMDQGEVTPTLKVRREAITRKYRDRLDALYEED
jgi:long-chain acyl-CoA synthetase